MKKLKKNCLLLLLFFLISNKAFQQTVAVKNSFQRLIGQYNTNGGPRFYIASDSSFCILKSKNRGYDLATADCDTISKGKFKFFTSSVLKLSDDTNYQAVKFNVKEEKRSSADSIYLKFDLPKDAAFFSGRFKYQISVGAKLDWLESMNSVIVLPKRKLYNAGDLYYHLTLIIQDLFPDNCEFKGNCYQKIFFNIFWDYTLNANKNYFTISLTNFNDCFVDHADLSNELVFVNKNKLYWRNYEFVKVN